MNAHGRNQENLTVFWDYDSTRASSVSSAVSTYDMVKNIRAAIAVFGAIKSFRAYSDFSEQALPRSINVRSELSSSGITLVDCPGDGRRELATKIMIVDVLIHAWDHSPPHIFVVITADRDLAYTVSSLRMRNYQVIVISPATTHRDLTAQASVQLDWSRVVLGIRGGVVDKDEDRFFDHPSAPEPSTSQPRHPPPESYGLRNTGPGDVGHTRDAQRHESPAEDLPPLRGRRNSVFSVYYDDRKSNVLGDFLHEFATPKSRTRSFGLGEGPLFPRPQSQAGEQSRADSAPPRFHSSSKLSMSGLPVHSSSSDQFQTPDMGHGSLKGKKRDLSKFEPFEPQGAIPEVSLESSHVPYSGSIFEPFGDLHSPPQAIFMVPVPKDNIHSSRTSSVSSVSTQFSQFSVVHPNEVSTAPTSAEPPSITDKSDTTLKAPVTVKDSTAANVTNTFSQRESDTTIPQTVSGVQSQPSETVVNPPAKEPVKKEINGPAPAKPSASTPQPFSRPGPSTPLPTKQGPPKATPVLPLNADPLPHVPPQFSLLIQTLRREQGGSTAHGVSKSKLGGALLKQNPNVYKQAGCSKFSTYIAAAISAGIVQNVTHRGEQGIALQTQYA